MVMANRPVPRTLTRAQQARRQRVVDAAMALGLDGGWQVIFDRRAVDDGLAPVEERLSTSVRRASGARGGRHPRVRGRRGSVAV